jgi:hypothetical protein
MATTPDDRIIAALHDAEVKAWEGLRGYKFWMFGYHAARWVNYNQLLPQGRKFRSPFRALVEIADKKIDSSQSELPLLEVSALPLFLLGSEGDGA